MIEFYQFPLKNQQRIGPLQGSGSPKRRPSPRLRIVLTGKCSWRKHEQAGEAADMSKETVITFLTPENRRNAYQDRTATKAGQSLLSMWTDPRLSPRGLPG